MLQTMNNTLENIEVDLQTNVQYITSLPNINYWRAGFAAIF